MISLRSVLLLVTLLALSLFGMKTGNAVLASILTTASIATLLFSLIAILHLRDSMQRAFWQGFAVFGFGFFLLMNSWLTHRSYLAATTELVYVTVIQSGLFDSSETAQADAKIQIGHALFVWIFAFVGGMISAYTYQAQRQETSVTKDGQSTVESEANAELD